MLKKSIALMMCLSLMCGSVSTVKAASVSNVKRSISGRNFDYRLTEQPAGSGRVYSGKCGDNAEWKLEDGVLTIHGSGAITSTPWKIIEDKSNTAWRAYPKKLVIEPGITSICDYAFAQDSTCDEDENGMEVEHLLFPDGITIPDTIKQIGAYAFEDVDMISITVPKSVETMGEHAFGNCKKLEEVVIEGTKKVGVAAFSEDTQLQKVTLQNGVEILDDSAFCGCSKLQDLKLADSIKEIGSSAFKKCSGLKQIQLPEGTIKIGKEALAGCESIKKLVIPKNVEKMETFDQDCVRLKKIENQSNESYSLKSSKLVKTWFEGKKKVTKVKPGKTVTAKGKKFKIKYKLKVNGKKVNVKGKIPKSYEYGKCVKLPQKVTVKSEKNQQKIFKGWKYECKDKKYQTGQESNSSNNLIREIPVGTKGNVTITPVFKSVKKKK